jgi:ParB family chromosome partitioning protein
MKNKKEKEMLGEKKLNMKEILRKRREERKKGEATGSINQKIEDLIQKSENVVHKIKLNELKQNPYQPRISIEKEELEELKKSISKNGLMSPIIVTEINGEKYIVAGHRRVQAFRELKKEEIPAIVRKDIDKSLLAILAITENTHRSNINPVELAISYKRLLDDGTFSSQKELAEALSINQVKLNRVLKILKLDERIINEVKNGKTKDLLALNLLNSVKDKDLQYKLFEKFLINGRNWLEEQIKNIKNNKEKMQEKFILKINPKKGKIALQINTDNVDVEKIKEIENKIKEILEEIV